MMEENNRKGPGIFYAVTGVATLVVAIIGATFAYFSATFTPEGTIEGTTGAGIEVGLVISEETNIEDNKLIPLDNETQMGSALTNACVDSNNNSVCKVYKIALTNTTETAVTAKGTLTLTAKRGEDAATGSNLKWKLIPSATSDNSNATVVNADATGNLHTNETGDALTALTGTQTYYVVVWLEEAGDQNDAKDANLSFTGAVTFNAVNADGSASSGLTATFSA